MTPTDKINKLVKEAAFSYKKEAILKLKDSDFGESYIKCVISNFKVRDFYYISGNYSEKLKYSEARKVIRDYSI